MPKKDEDLLGPLGHPGADYIRKRLRRRVMLELGITMRPKEIRKFLTCLDAKASISRIHALRDAVLEETAKPIWALEMEPLLIEFHGAWRYEGRQDILAQDLRRAASRYAVMHSIDALLQDCGFPTVRSTEDRMDDAAWYAPPGEER